MRRYENPRLVSALLVLLLAGCTSADPPRWHPPEESPTGSPSPTAPPVIELAFAGDVHFVDFDGGVPNRTGALLADPDTAFGPVAELFTAADVAMVNLETAVTTGVSRAEGVHLPRAADVPGDPGGRDRPGVAGQ